MLIAFIVSPLSYHKHANFSFQYFTPEQLEDLEGVLWKSYFA